MVGPHGGRLRTRKKRVSVQNCGLAFRCGAVLLLIHDLLPSFKEKWSPFKKQKYSSTKHATTVSCWNDCKFVRNGAYLIKATVRVCKHLHPSWKDGKHEKEVMAWVEKWKLLILHHVNEKRNYVIGRLAKLYTDEMGGVTSKKKKGRGGDEDEDDDEDGDGEEQAADLSNPKAVVIPDWLPTKQELIQLVMRDPKAWGYKRGHDTFDDEAKAAEWDVMLAFWSDSVISRVAGHHVWSPTKRCYKRLSTADDITVSTEALAVLLIENAYDRWALRVKHDVSQPELKIYKNKDGTYLPGLEGFETPYTSPNGGQQPFGGITEEGVKRFDDLVAMIKKNREENAEVIDRIEERARKIVYRWHDRKRYDDKKNKGKKKKRSKMAVPDQGVRVKDINMDDDTF